MENIYKWSKENKAIISILIIAFLLRLFTLINYQNELTLHSDDSNYIISGIEFLKSGQIVYGSNNEPTVFIMPGMALLLGGIFSITGYTDFGLIVARIPFILIGTLSVYGLYLIGKRTFNKQIGYIAALILSFSLPHLTLDNMFMTESPFTCILIFLIYYLFVYCESKKDAHFLILLSLYLIGLMFKPTISVVPILFLPYYVYNKFPIKLLLARSLYALVIIVVFMSPWWVRNYQAIGEFIPFTGNQGDTKLLGTYQGINFPIQPSMEEVNKYLDEKSRNGEYKHRYFPFKEKGEIANLRIKQWIKYDPKSFIYTYAVYKPLKIISSPYYPKKLFDINGNLVKWMHSLIVIIAAVGIVIWLFNIRKKLYKITILILLFHVIYFVYLNSYYLAIPRYNTYLMPLIFIIAAYAINSIVDKTNSFFEKG